MIQETIKFVQSFKGGTLLRAITESGIKILVDEKIAGYSNLSLTEVKPLMLIGYNTHLKGDPCLQLDGDKWKSGGKRDSDGFHDIVIAPCDTIVFIGAKAKAEAQYASMYRDFDWTA